VEGRSDKLSTADRWLTADSWLSQRCHSDYGEEDGVKVTGAGQEDGSKDTAQ